MNEHKYDFIEPGRARRDRHKDLKQTLKEPSSPERAVQLARLARDFHENREINLALDTAQQCLTDAGDDIALLLEAYNTCERLDRRIDDLSMLSSLGRWLEHEALTGEVDVQAYDAALRWCSECDGRDRERRIDTVRRRFGDGVANRIDLALL